MKSRSYILTFIFLFTVYLIFSDVLNNNVSSHTAGAPASRTGSPGDGNQSCTSCHGGSAAVQSGWITSDVPASGYVPGTVYTITSTATGGGHVKFGFEVSPQNVSGILLGTLINTSSETQLIGSNKYITHTSSGTSGSGSKTWTFNWTAPASGTGDVTFYGAFLVTNNDNSSGGDATNTSTLVVSECAPISQPGLIIGNTTVCSGSTQVYSVAAVSGAIGYTWGLPSGWSGSSTTESITVTVGSGSGTLSVATEGNCGNSAAQILAVTIDQLSVSTTHNNVSCNNGSNGSATAIPANGISPYTYSWLPSGGNSATASNLSARSYSVTVTDSTGCSAIGSATITQPITPLSASTAQTNVKCKGESTGTATVTASGGTFGYTYQWLPSGGVNPTAANLAAGTYSVTVTDQNGCSTSSSATITEPATPLNLSSVHTNVNCFGGATGSATVTTTGGTPGYTYSWSPSGGSSPTESNLTAGVYIVTVTDTNNCVSNSSSIITQPVSGINLSTGHTNANCNGESTGSATISATGGTGSYSYLWSPSGGTSAIASNLAAGTYNVIVTDSLSCNATTSVAVTQPNPISISFTRINVNCFGGATGTATAIASGGTPGYAYSWTPSGGNAATASNLTAGTYTVTVTDLHNCVASTNTIITQPLSALSAVSTHTNVNCNGGFTGTAGVTASGGTSGYTYLWSPTGGTSSTASNLVAGTYTVTVTDVHGCFITSSSVITQPGIMSATTSSTNADCNQSNGNGSITVSGGTPGYSYAWSTIPVQSTPAATGLDAGTYSVIVTDAHSCTRNFIVTVNDNSTLVVTVDTTINVNCYSGNNGSASVSVSGGVPGYSYSWFPSGGNSPTASNLFAGNYSAIITDSSGCISTALVQITQPDSLIANAGTDVSICNGESISIGGFPVASGGTLPYSYSWNPVTDLSSAIDSVPIANPQTTTPYTITVTDHNNCIANSSVLVTVHPLPQIPVITQNSDSLSSTPAISYQWFLNANPLSNDTERVYIPLVDGNYSVSITDSNGCSVISIPYHFIGVGIEEIKKRNRLDLFPNPFHDKTTIVYSVDEPGDVLMEVYRLTGEKITTLMNQKQDAGIYRISFFPGEKNISKGIYLLRFRINNDLYRQLLLEVL